RPRRDCADASAAPPSPFSPRRANGRRFRRGPHEPCPTYGPPSQCPCRCRSLVSRHATQCPQRKVPGPAAEGGGPGAAPTTAGSRPPHPPPPPPPTARSPPPPPPP